ncbi:MAG: hypothetical protein AAFU85_06245 [Planctomycetota bacterium]
MNGKGLIELTSAESTFLVQTHLKAQQAVHSNPTGFRPSDEVEKIRRREKQNYPQAAMHLFFEETVITEKCYSGLTYGAKPLGNPGSGTYFVTRELLSYVSQGLVDRALTNEKKRELRKAARELPRLQGNRLSYSAGSLRSDKAPQGILFKALKEANQHEESRFDALKRGPKGQLLPIDDKFCSRSGKQDQYSQSQADKYRRVSNLTGATAGAGANELPQISPMYFELPMKLEDPPKRARITRSGRPGAKRRANNIRQNQVNQIRKYGSQPRQKKRKP